MYQPKQRHKNMSVDMAAMCDIAFLLLVFFILSAKPKVWLPVNVSLPGTKQSSIRDLDAGYAEISIGEGKVFFSMPGKDTRKQALSKMAERYNLIFSTKELQQFAGIDVVGLPIASLKTYIDNYYNNKAYFNQTGIPINANNHELENWINEAQTAYKNLYDRDLGFMIRGDDSLQYPEIKTIMNILQSQIINKFMLATNLKH